MLCVTLQNRCCDSLLIGPRDFSSGGSEEASWAGCTVEGELEKFSEIAWTRGNRSLFQKKVVKILSNY